VLIVTGVLKDYAWGIVDGLVPWCQATGGPQAELWFGQHPAGPAPLADGSGTTLADFRHCAGMPLVKLLAVSAPLSIQVHPDGTRARAGFAAQVTKPREQWRYSDDAEKNEMVVALSAFDAHAGWRSSVEAAEVLRRAGAPDAYVDTVAHGDRTEAVRLLLGLDRQTCERIERNLVPAATASGWSAEAVSALARVAATHPADPGVLVTVLLQHHTLAVGEGLAVPAGVMHSYVDGLAVEVMTSSDNVLRLGLTPKPIAVDEALAAVRTDREPSRLGRTESAVVSGMPFGLDILEGSTQRRVATGAFRTVLHLDGQCVVNDVEVLPGQAAIMNPDDPEIFVQVSGRTVLVTGR
jgi:mannose-6-phosphate isomerase